MWQTRKSSVRAASVSVLLTVVITMIQVAADRGSLRQLQGAAVTGCASGEAGPPEEAELVARRSHGIRLILT
jgi:hypothetical protein